MKKLIVTLAIVGAAFSFAATASAQAAGPQGGAATTQTTQAKKPRVNAQKIMKEVLAQLGLSDDQKAKIKDLEDKNKQATKDLRAQVKAGTVTADDAKAKAKTQRQDYNKNLMAILTPDQQTQFKKLYKEAFKKAQEEASKTTNGSGTGN